MPWHDSMIEGAGVMLAVRDYGERGYPAVLVHGGPGQNLATWDDFAPLLTPEVRSVALDMRGNGASGDSDDYSLPALALDIRAVVEHFEMSRPLIVGHSWGGQLATYYASQFSDTGAVVGIDGWITNVRTDLTNETWRWIRDDYVNDPFITFAGTAEQLGKALEAIERMYGKAGAAMMRRQLAEGDGGVWRWRRTVDQLIHIQRTIDVESAILDTRLYEKVECPVLLIGGARSEEQAQASRGDRLGPWAFSRDATAPVVASYPRVREVWLPCGHDIPHDLPAPLAALIKDLASSL